MKKNIETEMDLWEETLRFLEIESVKKRSTGTLVFLCPFHNEKSPSLHVFHPSGRFFCHGCHASGTLDNFIQEWFFKDDPPYLEYLTKMRKQIRERIMARDSNQLWLFPEFQPEPQPVI